MWCAEQLDAGAELQGQQLQPWRDLVSLQHSQLIDSIEKMITCYFLTAKIECNTGRFFCVRDQKLTPYLDALSRCKNCYFTWFRSNEVALVCDVVLGRVCGEGCCVARRQRFPSCAFPPFGLKKIGKNGAGLQHP
jgi:hypothetical protein